MTYDFGTTLQIAPSTQKAKLQQAVILAIVAGSDTKMSYVKHFYLCGSCLCVCNAPIGCHSNFVWELACKCHSKIYPVQFEIWSVTNINVAILVSIWGVHYGKSADSNKNGIWSSEEPLEIDNRGANESDVWDLIFFPVQLSGKSYLCLVFI